MWSSFHRKKYPRKKIKSQQVNRLAGIFFYICELKRLQIPVVAERIVLAVGNDDMVEQTYSEEG